MAATYLPPEKQSQPEHRPFILGLMVCGFFAALVACSGSNIETSNETLTKQTQNGLERSPLVVATTVEIEGSVYEAFRPAVIRSGVPYIEIIRRGVNRQAKENADDMPGPWTGDTTDECYSETTEECAVQNDPEISWGLEVLCSGNFGCAMSTFAYSIASPPAGVSAVWSPSPVAPATYSNSTITTTAQTPLGKQMLSYAATVASGPGPAPTNLALPSQFLCGIAAGTCPKIQIFDNDLKTATSGSPPPITNTVVGEQQNLTAQYVPNSGPAPSYSISPSWTIAGEPITSYPLGVASAPLSGPTTVPVVAGDLSKLSPTPFFWLTSGIEDLVLTTTLTGTLSDGNGAETAFVSTQASYNVLAPTGVSISASVPGEPTVIVPTPGVVSIGLLNKTTSSKAIVFHFKMTAPAGGAGTLAATQIVLPCFSYVQNGTSEYFTNNAMNYELDNGSLYESLSGYPGQVPTGQQWTSYDAPYGTTGSEDVTSINNADAFQTYFLYKPTGAGAGSGNGIWVPLGNLSWGFSASSMQTMPNSWTAAGGSVVTPTSTVEIGTDLPTWSGVAGTTTTGTTDTYNCASGADARKRSASGASKLQH